MVAAQFVKSADKAQHAMEYIRAGPRGVERSVPSRAGAGDRAIIGIVRKVEVFANLGQDLFDQEGRKATAHGIVFRAAVEARLSICTGSWDHTGGNEHPDGNQP